jgi:hypothetical protein
VIPVVADADTLFGGTTRGLLIHLDYHGLIPLHWSALILDELSRTLDAARRAHTLTGLGQVGFGVLPPSLSDGFFPVVAQI